MTVGKVTFTNPKPIVSDHLRTDHPQEANQPEKDKAENDHRRNASANYCTIPEKDCDQSI
jgi:hypothetical protein